MKCGIAVLGLAAAVFGGPARAELLPGAAPPVQAGRLAAGEAVRMDGRLDEAVWSRVQPLDQFYEIDPGDRLPRAAGDRPVRRPSAQLHGVAGQRSATRRS